jgi:hypothetical protein
MRRAAPAPAPPRPQPVTRPREPSAQSEPAPPPRRCNPNYEGACLPLTGDAAAPLQPELGGACLPLAGDVDCGGISATNIRVVGDDRFRLDGDGDGVGCES